MDNSSSKEETFSRSTETSELLESMMHYPEILGEIPNHQWQPYPDLTIPPLGTSHEELMQEHSYHLPSSASYSLPLSGHLRNLSQIDIPHEVEQHSPFPSISGSPHDIFRPTGLNPPFSSLPLSNAQQKNAHRYKQDTTKNMLRFRYTAKVAAMEDISGKYHQPSLSKAAVSENGVFICGTDSRTNPNVVAGLLQGKKLNFFSKSCAKHFRDAHWNEIHDKFVVATGNSIVVCNFDNDSITEDSFEMKDVHGAHCDDIRELAIDHHNPNLVLSGGFDKRLLITDLSVGRVVKPYYSRHVIGSVRWYPTCSEVVSFTCDTGSISMFDIRDHSPRVPIVFHTGNPLYAHEYINQNIIALGQASGSIELFDIRMKSIIQRIDDTGLDVIGDIQEANGDYLLVSGSSRTTFWEQNEEGIEKVGSDLHDRTTMGDPQYQTSGSFWTNKNAVVITDTEGCISVFGYQDK